VNDQEWGPDNQVPEHEKNLEISPEQERIAEELVSFWQAQQHRPIIISEIDTAQGSRLGQIEDRLKKLTDRERTILHLATGPLRWRELEGFFGKLGGVALGTDAMLKHYPKRAETALNHIQWLQLLNMRADKGDDSAAQLLAEIGRDAIKDFKKAISNYARTRLAMVAGRLN
jgi:hypothetical protein